MLFNVCQAQVKVDVSNLKEDIGKLKSQIVESPEELKSQMEKIRENVKNIKISIVSQRQKQMFSQGLRLRSTTNDWLYSCLTRS